MVLGFVLVLDMDCFVGLGHGSEELVTGLLRANVSDSGHWLWASEFRYGFGIWVLDMGLVMFIGHRKWSYSTRQG